MILGSLARFRLRPLLVAGSVVTALVPALTLLVGAALNVRQQYFERSADRGRIVAEGLAREFEQYAEFHLEVIRLLAQNVGSLESMTEPAIKGLLNRGRTNHPGLSSRVIFVDAVGQAQVVESINPNDPKLNYADRDWFKVTVRTRQAQINPEVLIGRTDRRPTLPVAAPVIDSGGTLRGVIAASIDLAKLQGIPAEVRLGRTGNTVVATAKGQPIAHPVRAVVDEQRDLTKQPVWSTVSSAHSGEIASYIGIAGDERIGGFATVPGIGWKVWVSISTAEVENDIFEAFRWIAVVATGALLIAIGVIYFFLTRSVISPLDDVRKAAISIAQGDLSSRASESGPADVRELAHALNVMADSLKRIIEGERAAKASIQAAVAEYGRIAARVAGGDLTVRAAVDQGSEFLELGTNFNAMVGSLQQLVSEIGDAASSIASASGEILAATKQQASATAEEASAVRQTAVSVSQVKETAQLASQRAKAVSEMAQRASKVAEDGRRSVEESLRGSEEAKARVESLAERILAFSDKVQTVGEINATVNDLAEQSNLLAVNAGIEAAKAGEAGKGFAVVAQEVKDLADQCKQATAQVRAIVAEIQRATQAATLSAEQVMRSAESGVSLASRSGEAIRALAQNVADAANAAQQIVASAQQQAVGMDQIATAMSNVEQSSSQTVSATEQMERAATDLNALASRLDRLVEGVSRRRQASAAA